jgi:hypothetical protein
MSGRHRAEHSLAVVVAARLQRRNRGGLQLGAPALERVAALVPWGHQPHVDIKLVGRAREHVEGRQGRS